MDGRINTGPGVGLPPGQSKKAGTAEDTPTTDPQVQLTGDQSTIGSGRRGGKSQTQETATLYNAAMPWDLIDSIYSSDDEDEEAAQERRLEQRQTEPQPTREPERTPTPTAQREVPREPTRTPETTAQPQPREAEPEPERTPEGQPEGMIRQAEPEPQMPRPAAAPAPQPTARAPQPQAQPQVQALPPSQPATVTPPTPAAPTPQASAAPPAPAPAQSPAPSPSTPVPVLQSAVPQAPRPLPVPASPVPQGAAPSAKPAPAPSSARSAAEVPDDDAPTTQSAPPTRIPATASPVTRSAITGNLDPTVLLRFKHRDLAEALKLQLANPEEVVQLSGKATCCAATLQRALVKLDPKLYAAIASDLIMNGQAHLPGGQELKLSPANRAWIDAQPMSPKEKVNALMQAAFMELADPHGDYDLAADHFARHENLPRGLNLDQARRLNELLLQAPTLDPRELRGKINEFLKQQGVELPTDGPDLPQALVKDLLRSASEQTAFAIVRARDPEGKVWVDDNGKPLVEAPEDEQPTKQSHMVMIVGVDDDANTVTIIDAVGKQRTLPRDKFAQLMLMSNKWEDLEGIGSPLGMAAIE